MRSRTTLTLGTYALIVTASLSAIAQTDSSNWPQWRGPLCNGIAPNTDPPITWSEEQNIKWKVALPGHGNATPIIWGNKVFILAAVETDRKADPAETTSEEATSSGATQRPQTRPRPAAQRPAPHPMPGEGRPSGMRPGQPVGEGRPGGMRSGQPPMGRPSTGQPPRRGGWRAMFGSGTPTNYHQFLVLCLDRQTGKTLWKKTAREEVPHQGHHRDGDYASFSPMTDGSHVYAYFGSQGLFCYDLDGNLQWERDLGKMNIVMRFGEGGSPALAGDRIFVNFDHEGDSYLAALDKRTGKTVWKVARDEGTSWSTPLIVTVDGKQQVIVSASGRVRGYSAASGEVIWECGGQTRNVIPTPVVGHGLVFATSGFRGSTLHAIELGRQGDLTDSDAIRWQLGRGTPYVPSPLLYGDKLYLFEGNRATLSCYQAATGEPNYERVRLEEMSGVYASPVGTADRIYFAGRGGTTSVVKNSSKLEVLAINKLDDAFDASPALVGKELFLRGKQNLYCISSQ